MKSVKIIIILFVFLLLGYILGHFFSFPFWNTEKESGVLCTMDAKECSDGSYVGRIPPDCEFSLCPGEEEGILVSSPKSNETIKTPLKIKGEARGTWFFEAQFNAVIVDAHGSKLGEAILTTKSDWMTNDFVPFESELNFVQPPTSLGTLKFLSANPSGLPEHQKIFEVPVQFTETSYKKVLLYYYNSEKDKDESGNIQCSRNGLAVIERQIPTSKTPIQDVINLLLKGKENLTQEEIEQGISTEYPLEGFYLAEANFKEDGTLILRFNDSLNKTSGGACRVGILWFQIEATAKQFTGVEEVRFLPEELFQP